MATAITLTVVFGKEIGNFFSTLFPEKSQLPVWQKHRKS